MGALLGQEEGEVDVTPADRLVRHAIDADRLRIVALLRDSHKAAGFTFPFHPAYAEHLFKTHVAEPDACCIAYAPDEQPQGVLMARSFDHPFGPFKLAKETVWWIDPNHRGTAAIRMLSAYEEWAREQGCVSCGMAAMAANMKPARIYEHRGYRQIETHFLKAL